MKLSHEEAELFFTLMWALQYFANERLGIIPRGKTLKKYTKRSMEEKHKVRDGLFANMHLIDEFIQENPEQLAPDHLNIIAGWKRCITGRFYIERLLKKYAIFIKEKDVYGVLGLHQGLDEVIPHSYLPVCVEAVLLPFNGRIIYDGLLESYNVFFGSGITSELKECYMIAKHNNQIITNLESTANSTQHLVATNT
jgi:hypothetical protein